MAHGRYTRGSRVRSLMFGVFAAVLAVGAWSLPGGAEPTRRPSAVSDRQYDREVTAANGAYNAQLAAYTQAVEANQVKAYLDAAYWNDVQAWSDAAVAAAAKPPVVPAPPRKPNRPAAAAARGRSSSPTATGGGGVTGACGGATNGADAFIGRESGGNPNARNPSGAWGCYQIMPGTWAGSCSDLGQHGSASTAAQAACASRLPRSSWSSSGPT